MWVLGIAILGSPLARGQVPAPNSPPIDSSRIAPDFVLETISGKSFRLSDHRGDVVVLNFWATWCGPCRYEIPRFIELQRRYDDQNLQFVGVALQRGAGAERVRRYAQHIGINYPVGVDDNTISQQYGGVRRLPTTFVIGPQGEIRKRFLGVVPNRVLRTGLKRMLRGSP